MAAVMVASWAAMDAAVGWLGPRSRVGSLLLSGVPIDSLHITKELSSENSMLGH
jgi:hypothetical protein